MNSYDIAKSIYRNKTISKYLEKDKLLGFNDINRVISFLNTRSIISFLLFFLVFVLSAWDLVISLVITLLFYYFYGYFYYDCRIKVREKNLEQEAIYFFEILSLTIESGKNLIQGIEITTNHTSGDLTDEFNKTLKEVKYGKSFNEAFTDLRKRIPSDIIENVILNIIEAYNSGSDISKTLLKQTDFIRNKRVMDIKERINKIPVKISIVSVFLFIPLILLLILAPVILEYFV